MAGPSLAGTLADISRNFGSSYLFAAGLTAIASFLALLLPSRKEDFLPDAGAPLPTTREG